MWRDPPILTSRMRHPRLRTTEHHFEARSGGAVDRGVKRAVAELRSPGADIGLCTSCGQVSFGTLAPSSAAGNDSAEGQASSPHAGPRPARAVDWRVPTPIELVRPEPDTGPRWTPVVAILRCRSVSVGGTPLAACRVVWCRVRGPEESVGFSAGWRWRRRGRAAVGRVGRRGGRRTRRWADGVRRLEPCRTRRRLGGPIRVRRWWA